MTMAEAGARTGKKGEEEAGEERGKGRAGEEETVGGGGERGRR